MPDTKHITPSQTEATAADRDSRGETPASTPPSTSPADHAPTEIHSPTTGDRPTAPFGTLIDDQFRAANDSHEPMAVTAWHMTQMEALDVKIETNQVDAQQRPIVAGYKLLHRIGKGAYGTVWVAESLESEEEHVAIKFFTLSQWEPMHREVSRIARLEGCTGVVSFKRYAGKKEDPPYYVMPYARKGSLADLLKQRGPLPVAEAVPLFARIVETMAFVHTKGVIHCDLKPANILLNESGEPLVADFGQAQINSTEAGAFGTLFYMPPEQASAKNTLPDASWDVYALGAMLYEMLTGEKPRATAETIHTLSQIKDIRGRLATYREALQNSPRLSLKQAVQKAAPANAKRIDPALAALVENCLAIDPTKRPRSGGHIGELLKRRAWWLRTRPGLIAGLAATLLAILALTGLGVYAAKEIVDENERQTKKEALQSLRRTSHIASQLVTEKLQDRVQFVQDSAKDAQQELWLATLPAMLERIRENPKKADEALTGDERELLNKWLLKRSNLMPWYRTPGASKSMVVFGVAKGRGYILALVNKEGKTVDPKLDPEKAKVFRTNFAWRDYFNGKGTRFDEKGLDVPQPPIEHCHISQVIKSATEDRWQIVVSAPIRDKQNQIVGLVVVGVDVVNDLLVALNDTQGDHDLSDNRGKTDQSVDIVLVNDRGCWAWHPRADYKNYENRDPEPLYDEHNQNWLYGEAAGTGTYNDPFPEVPDKPECLASYEHFHPYRAGDDDTLYKKKWIVIAQMSEETARAPLAEMRIKLYKIGAVALILLGGLSIALWTWWIRTLRRQEMVAHG